jgi:hypothetical protein
MATPIRIRRSAVPGKRPTVDQLLGAELAYNTYDGYLFAKRDTSGVGIGTTVALLTPWTENFGAGSIYYSNSVGIGTTNATSTLHVVGNELVTGVITATTFSGQINSGVSTLGIATATNLTLQQLRVSGVSTLGVTSVTNLTAQSVNSSGIVTGSSFRPSSGYYQSANGTNSFYVYDGTGNVAFQGTIGASQVNNASGYKVIGFDGTNITFESDAQIGQNAYIVGVTTSVGGFVGNLTGTATTATKLQTPRTFEITGDIVASPISFDGTGNVSLAATIQPNSVGLGTDTFGDYVKDIAGTSQQIVVTGGTGEGSTPTLSLPTNLVVPQDLTVNRDLQVNRNLNVDGNITIGGTTAFVNVQELVVTDPDIILGYRTDSFGNDISNDNTSNHGGVALASTEGTPLVDLFIAGIETAPTTYKKIMWFKEGTFSGLGTDAWLINYAVGIGSTQFPTGTRLAAGSVQFTENDLAVVRNINASGIGTIGTLDTTTGTIDYLTNTNLNTSGIGTIETLDTTTGTIDYLSGTNVSYSGIATLGIATIGDLYVSGVSTFVGISTFENNVSIGGTLDVDGNINFNGSLSQNNSPFIASRWTATTVGNDIYRLSNVGIGSTQPSEKLDVAGNISINSFTVIGSATTTLATSAQTSIHSTLSGFIYRSVEYTIQATEGTNYHSTKIFVLHDGAGTAYHSEYGTIFNNGPVAIFDVDVNENDIRLLATGSSSTTKYLINFTAIKL